jgi:hypothetical protein
VHAQLSALYRIITGEPGPHEVDVAGVIARRGLSRVAAFLTSTIMNGMNQVARKRGGHLPPAAVLEEYVNRFFAHQPDELREMVLSQVRDGRHPPIQDPEMQEVFLLGLLTLHAAAAIELAGKSPREHR